MFLPKRARLGSNHCERRTRRLPRNCKRCVVIEVGTHSRWVSALLEETRPSGDSGQRQASEAHFSDRFEELTLEDKNQAAGAVRELHLGAVRYCVRSITTMSECSCTRSKTTREPSGETSKSPMTMSRPKLVNWRQLPVVSSHAHRFLCWMSPRKTTNAACPGRNRRRLAPTCVTPSAPPRLSISSGISYGWPTEVIAFTGNVVPGSMPEYTRSCSRGAHAGSSA